MSLKISKKELKREGEEKKAIYCGGNVYTHENIIYYITHKDIKALEKMVADYKGIAKNIEKIIDIVYTLEDYIIYDEIVCYSVGIYGNSGQLVRYTARDEKNGIIKEFYTFYC